MKKDIVIKGLEEIPLDNLIKYLKVFQEGVDLLSMYSAFDLLCGIPKEVVNQLTFKDANNVYTAIQLELKKKTKLRRSFVLNGVTYGMIPNLETASVGEYGDLDKYITPAFTGDIKHKDAFKFMSVLYRPITSGSVDTVYRIEEYSGTGGKWQVMKKAPSDVYLNSVAFFLNLKLDLLRVSRKYLANQKIKKAMDKLTKEQPTTVGMDGLELLMKSQEEMCYDGMMQLELRLPRLLPGLLREGKRTK